MKKTIQTLSIALLIFTAFPGYGQTIYIAQNATGNGSSWANASGNLKAALDSAFPGTEIWVKAGTYYPTTCSSCSFSQKNTWFDIPNGVKLYGGFAGTETAAGQRDIPAQPTYLSGDIDQDGTLTNNSFTVVHTVNVSSLTLVDGFIVTGGNAVDVNSGTGAPQNSGGGWFNTGSTNGFSSSPVIRNCRFENNYAFDYGGGMMNDGSFTGSSNTAYINCVFRNNNSRLGGGAIYNSAVFSGNCSPSFTDCIFENNKCVDSDGGAIFNIGSESGTCNPNLSGCDFINNTAGHDGGAMYSFGKSGNSSPVLTNCSFDNNSAKQGGAIYSDGTFNGFSGAQFSDCQFTNNTSSEGDGAAIYNSGFKGTCNPVLTNCQFIGNTSTLAGGAVFNNGVEGVCNPAFTNCRFLNNHAITFGGSIYNQGREGNASPTITNCVFAENLALSAGAIYNLGSTQGNANAVITNCTFYKNNANVGGAVYANAGEDASGTSSPTITNCIFWENTANDIGDIFRIINGTPTISYSLVDKIDCDDLYHGNGGTLNCIGGMIFNENPMFVNAPGGNFHLANNSPAIDDGDNSAVNQSGVNVDLDNLPRIFNSTVDFGVFEYGSMAGNGPTFIQQPMPHVICAGEPVSFSVSAAGSQPLTFQWFKDGQAISGAEGDVLTINSASPADQGDYTCVVTNASGDNLTSNSAFLTVNLPAVVSLVITASEETVCAGEEITLTANPVNGGNAPTYQWFINGNAFGGNIQSFTIDVLNDGDMFTCEVTSSETCVENATAISDVLTIHVENNLTAALSVVPDEATPCEGQLVTFTAMPEHGGTSPSFQWSVDGNLIGSNSLNFAYNPQQTSEVLCVMVSSLACVLENMVTSAPYILNVMPNEVSTVLITPSVDSTICIGAEVVFTAEIEHGGDFPVYDWRINNLVVGDNDPVFTTNMLNNGDEVACYLNSSLACLIENPVVSNSLVVSVDSCMVAAREQNVIGPNVLLYPNPAHGRIFVEIWGLSSNFTTRLLNTHGQVLLSNYEKHPIGSLVKQEIDLTDLPQGIYYFQIITDGTITTKRIVVF